jgi:hypothetical protein
MVSRREIEQMILKALGQIRTIEESLNRRFHGLSTARLEARLEFHWSLQDLENRTSRLERLVEALDQQITNTATAV